jgi:hypothetical protein
VKRGVLVISGIVGATLGGTVAYIGATRIFTCAEPTFEAVCAGGPPILLVAWGMVIGVVVGLLAGLVYSRRSVS